MKKTNKILTRALVILLALVLITSSVVSSTFAKYVITKKAETTVGLREFGLDITVTPKLGLLGDGVQTEKNGKSLKITYNNLSLKPNDSFKEALEIRVDGTPVVDAKITIDVLVAYNSGDNASTNAFEAKNTDFSSIPDNAASLICVPIAFIVNDKNATDSYNQLSASDAAEAIEQKIADEMSGFDMNDTNTAVTKTIRDTNGTYDRVEEIINFGFEWKDGTGNTNQDFYNHFGTWIAERGDTVTVTYTVTVEQITGT